MARILQPVQILEHGSITLRFIDNINTLGSPKLEVHINNLNVQWYYKKHYSLIKIMSYYLKKPAEVAELSYSKIE